jgi:glutamine cyclotransferase
VVPGVEEITEVAGHGILIMGDRNATFHHREPEDFRVGNAVEAGSKGASKFD